MFLKYTKAKIQVVLRFVSRGYLTTHQNLPFFKKIFIIGCSRTRGEQSVEASPSQSPWPWSNNTPRKSLITLILNNHAGCRAFLRGWVLSGGLELQEKFPFLTFSKKSSKNPICMTSSKKLEDNDIPLSLVLNLNQTPSKYIPVLNKTMAPYGSRTVSFKGSTEKTMITATFTITLDSHFLPVQLIYGGKTIEIPLNLSQHKVATRNMADWNVQWDDIGRG